MSRASALAASSGRLLLASAIPAALGAAAALLVSAEAARRAGRDRRASGVAEQRREEMVWLAVSLKRLDQLTCDLADTDLPMTTAAVHAAAGRAGRAFDEASAALARVTIDLDVVADEDMVLELRSLSDPKLSDPKALAEARSRLSAARAEASRSRAALRGILTRRVNGPDRDLSHGSALAFWMSIRSELASGPHASRSAGAKRSG